MDHNASGSNWGNVATGTTFTDVTSVSNVSLVDGADGDAATTAQMKSAYEKFQDAETVDAGLIIAGSGDATHIDNLITIAESRKDAVVFASPISEESPLPSDETTPPVTNTYRAMEVCYN